MGEVFPVAHLAPAEFFREQRRDVDALSVAVLDSDVSAGAQQAAADRFGLDDVLVVHRHGHLPVGEPIMMVATAARHRRAAFDAADFLMDWLKSRAPFWKREIGPDGPRGWVEARADDEAALDRW